MSYSSNVRDAMRKALAVKAAEDEASGEEDAPTATVTYIRCKRCGNAQSYERFMLQGAQLHACICRPGREEWAKVHIDMKEPEPRVIKP